MWVLMWFQVVVGMSVQSFHLGSYSNYKQCEYALEQAKVMKTSTSIKIACLELNKGLPEEDN